jgi:hypothetical protein
MPITITRAHFDFLAATKDKALIEKDPDIQNLKNSFVDTLNKYLPVLQEIREAYILKTTVKFDKAFKYDIHPEPHHWYIVNFGGVNEIQYNVGMSPDIIRYGLGIFLGKRQNVDPPNTEKYYNDLCAIIKNDRNNFDRLVRIHDFRLEWGTPTRYGIVSNSQSPNVTDELLTIKTKYSDLEWIFVGKILECANPGNAKLIYNPNALQSSVKSVCQDLWKYYETAQRLH